jgi:hypothetical protein
MERTFNKIIIVLLKSSEFTFMEGSNLSSGAEDLFDLGMGDFTMEKKLIWDYGESLFSYIYPSIPEHSDIPPFPVPFTQADGVNKGLSKKVSVIRGTGPEAAKTAQYLARDNSRSLIFCTLHRRYGFVSRSVLMSVITGILASCPEQSRPTPPDRSMKRAKGGLIAWLDKHQVLALKYLDEVCDVINEE